MTSFGLVVGCGDDGSQVSQSGTSPTTTITTASSTIDTTTAGTVDLTDGTSTSPGTTDGTGGMTDSSTTAPTTTDPTTGMVTATMGTTESSTTDVLTTEPPETSSSTSTTEPPDTTTSTTEPPDTTTDVSSSSSSTTEPGTTTEDIPCDEMQVVLTPVVPNVMLVLDKSGSMLTKWDHDANPGTATVTRWFSLWAVVDQVLTAFNADFNFGMNLFPNKQATDSYNATACPVNANVEIKVAPFNKNAIINALPAQNNMTIKGGTPAAAGVTAALTHLKSLDPMIPRAIMLITDGAANCTTGAQTPQLFEQYDQSLHTVVGNAFTQDGIPTYVIGIAIANAVSPGPNMDGNPDMTNPYVKLNELATQGGTAKAGAEKFYNADNQNELQTALNAIVSDAQSCVIALQSEPGFPDFTKVKIGGVEVPKINDCATENGWKYVDPAPPYAAIELCGTACGSLKQTGEAGVEYFCMPG